MQPIYEHLFGDQRPFAECHAASIAELADGRFLAAWFGGTAERHPDTAIWGATRTTAGWSAPRRIARAREAAHWNPVLFRSPEGALHLFFKVGADPMVWETWTMTSDDDGASWSPVRELIPGDVGGRGPVKNKPIVLSDGAWLAPGSRETGDDWYVVIDRSEDQGRTWAASVPPIDRTAVTGLGVIQPTIWESQSGYVHLLARSTCGRICRSDSTDGGRSWSPVRPTDLPNNNSGIDLARLSDGTLVLAYNPVAGDWAARTPLALALSSDNGATWRHWCDLETEVGEYSYPAIIPTASGIAVCYTWRRERIAWWMASLP